MLMQELAAREGTARQLADRWNCTTAELREFVDNNREELERIRQQLATEQSAHTVTPTQLDELWITSKFQRLMRIQQVAEKLQRHAAVDNMAAREFRSYLTLAANELGQLLHRGAGESAEGDTLRVDISGVDLETLR